MINKAVEILKNDLEEYLQQVSNDPAPKVEYTDLSDDSNLPATKIGMTLVSIEEERGHKSMTPTVVRSGGTSATVMPDIKLNLYLMFTAFNESDYLEGLKKLSDTVTFFQSKKVFNQENTPALDDSIEHLFVDLHNLTTEQQNDLWGKFGVKYRPSICYRVRMLIMQRGAVTGEAPLLQEVDVDLDQNNN